MSDLEYRYGYLRTEERQKSFLVTELDLKTELLVKALMKLQNALISINDSKKIANADLAEVRDFLAAKGMDPIHISERDRLRAQVQAEDELSQRFYSLNSIETLKRAGEREESVRKYREARDAKGYDSDYDL